MCLFPRIDRPPQAADLRSAAAPHRHAKRIEVPGVEGEKPSEERLGELSLGLQHQACTALNRRGGAPADSRPQLNARPERNPRGPLVGLVKGLAPPTALCGRGNLLKAENVNRCPT
jgi:hypothetical protein